MHIATAAVFSVVVAGDAPAWALKAPDAIVAVVAQVFHLAFDCVLVIKVPPSARAAMVEAVPVLMASWATALAFGLAVIALALFALVADQGLEG